jgi:hyperosmotically inducible protein
MARTLLLLIAGLVFAMSPGCRMNEAPEDEIEDAGIANTIKGKLTTDSNSSTLSNISVDVANGVVTLSGQVASAERKHRAEEIARSVDGVTRVNDDLQIKAHP